jgi:outer membrane protein TolC
MPPDQHWEKSTRFRFATLRVYRVAAIFCRAVVGLFTLVFLVSGCMVGPDFVKPEAQVEEGWLQQHNQEIKSEPADFSEWWSVFNDPVLDNLIEIASRQNLDLQNAGLRILEARAQLGIAVGFQYPQTQQIGGEANANQLSENAPNGAGADKFFYNYQFGFDAAWVSPTMTTSLFR